MNKHPSYRKHLFLGLLLLCIFPSFSQIENGTRPNFIIIFTDDQGYGDLGCYGNSELQTPNIDQMAEEGTRLTSFYSAAPLCTPSRAALLTGSYPIRTDMAFGSTFPVLLAADSKGLNPNEITLAELLGTAGYATGMFGKWHLGDQPAFLPTRQGFDEFYGIPYSHDIHPFHPDEQWDFPPLPLLDGEKVIESEPDADFLTKNITERAVSFIEKHKDSAFFLYIPHPLPHVPIHVSPPFMEKVDDSIKKLIREEGQSIDYKTRNKIYPQAINEIDWSVGQILATLKKYDLIQNTFVIFTSDNGPAVGSAGPLKGKKGTTHEGGMRVPAVVYWPGVIPAGETNDEIMTTMDLLATFAKLANTSLPSDRILDGKDIMPTIQGTASTPHEAFFYYRDNDLQAVRAGQWKLRIEENRPMALYNLKNDIGESKDVLSSNPKVAENLLEKVRAFKSEVEKNSRPAGFVDNPVALKK